MPDVPPLGAPVWVSVGRRHRLHEPDLGFMTYPAGDDGQIRIALAVPWTVPYAGNTLLGIIAAHYTEAKGIGSPHWCHPHEIDAMRDWRKEQTPPEK